MFRFLLLLFIIVPIVEIYFLIAVGKIIGVWPTVGLVILTAVMGTYLLRRQGLATLQKLQATTQRGEFPAETLLEGIFLLIGGVLLLTPGFFTDAFGFACLLPPTRAAMIHFAKIWLQPRVIMQSGTWTNERGQRQGPVTLDGEFRRDD